jgi:hypothetical protein
MASSPQTLNSATSIITIYVGFFNIISGVIGNIIIILVFTQLKLFRGNQSAFYLTVVSSVDGCQLIFGMSTRVLTTAFGYDPTRTSLVWCKFRAYMIQFAAVIGTITICFSAIDQYLATNDYVRLRQLSTFKLAKHAVASLIIFAVLYDIPFAMSFEICKNVGCGTYNPAFNYFYSFVHLCILIGILPIVISSFFGLLAYQNVRRIVRRHMPIFRRRLDHQLTAMVLVRVVLLVITTIPYISIRMYQLNNLVDENNTLAVALNQLIKMAFTAVYAVDNSVGDFLFLY